MQTLQKIHASQNNHKSTGLHKSPLISALLRHCNCPSHYNNAHSGAWMRYAYSIYKALDGCVHTVTLESFNMVNGNRTDSSPRSNETHCSSDTIRQCALCTKAARVEHMGKIININSERISVPRTCHALTGICEHVITSNYTKITYSPSHAHSLILTLSTPQSTHIITISHHFTYYNIFLLTY